MDSGLTNEIFNHYLDLQKELNEREIFLPENEREDHQKRTANIIAESLISNRDDANMKLLTNFRVDEFLNIYNDVCPVLEEGVHKDSIISPQTKLLMMLCYLKYNENWRILARNFGINKSYAFGIVYTTIKRTVGILEEKYIKWKSVEDRLTHTNDKFEDYPLLLGSVDATVQRIQKPSQNQEEYYSGKHKCHCIKVQAFVSPEGLLMNHSKLVKGAVHDFNLFKNSELIEKIKNENIICNRLFNNNCTILADAGYQGISKLIPGSISPFKKSRNSELNDDQKAFNKKISHRRIIVENWFSRLKNLWGVMSNKYRLSLTNYNEIWSICAALTNYHIMNYPLKNLEPDVEIEEDYSESSDETEND